MAIEFSENFERGTLGEMVTKDNTAFWNVVYWSVWDDGAGPVDHPEENQIRFTDDAYGGGLAATIPPEVMRAAGYTDNYLPMTILGSSPDNVIIDEPVDITWLYKFRSNPEPFFGRNVFEASFGKIGDPILRTDGDAPYPDYDYKTHLGISLEHSNEDIGDDPDGMYYDHYNINKLYEPGVPRQDVITPQFPQNIWLKMRFTWQGAGLPFTLKVTNADNESVVHADITHTAPQGLGLGYWEFFAITHWEDSSTPERAWLAGYDFQNWFDGIGATAAVAGEQVDVRRRFYY